ncbi:MAG: hypothetical protein SCALA702_07090 [Melioribacteraceae bacterium]|nr:MAG: hypothetical protein SCALA702_07090 [Melioribacteraceae bacterium]
MLKRSTHILAAIVVLLVLFVDVFAGGGKRNGTGGAQELLIPVGARGLALSGAYTSGITGLDAIYYNPAGLGAAGGNAEAMFSYMNYIADINFTYAAAAFHMEDFGSIGISVRSLDFGDIPYTTIENPYGTGATFSPTFVIFGVTYSNALTDRIRVGLNVNLITEEIERVAASGVAFDAGVQYNGLAGIEGLKFGLVLKNLGPKMQFSGPDLLRSATDDETLKGAQFREINAAAFELPSQMELGLAYERRFSDLYSATFSSSFQNNTFSNDEYKFAGEFVYDNMVFIRGGYTYVSEAANVEEESIFGPTFGVGFKVPGDLRLGVDYAFRSATYFDANHMVTLNVGF